LSAINYIKQSYLDRLKNSVNPEFYNQEKATWLQDFYEGGEFSGALKQPLNNEIKLIEDGKPSSDFENVKTIHSAFRFIEPRLLAYEGLWVYFTHVYFWQYMQKRWIPKEPKKMTSGMIKERFFLKGEATRGLLRNGIARLWFLGHMTFDSENENDHYHLTEILLSNQEVLESLVGRPKLFSSKNFRIAILKLIKNNQELLEREKFRKLLMQFIYLSGIRVLDAYSSDELVEMLQQKINNN
jgi:hypothetical protein